MDSSSCPGVFGTFLTCRVKRPYVSGVHSIQSTSEVSPGYNTRYESAAFSKRHPKRGRHRDDSNNNNNSNETITIVCYYCDSQNNKKKENICVVDDSCLTLLQAEARAIDITALLL